MRKKNNKPLSPLDAITFALMHVGCAQMLLVLLFTFVIKAHPALGVMFAVVLIALAVAMLVVPRTLKKRGHPLSESNESTAALLSRMALLAYRFIMLGIFAFSAVGLFMFGILAVFTNIGSFDEFVGAGFVLVCIVSIVGIIALVFCAVVYLRFKDGSHLDEDKSEEEQANETEEEQANETEAVEMKRE